MSHTAKVFWLVIALANVLVAVFDLFLLIPLSALWLGFLIIGWVLFFLPPLTIGMFQLISLSQGSDNRVTKILSLLILIMEITLILYSIKHFPVLD